MAKASKSTGSVECAILRDYWDDDGTRHRKGERVTVTADEAMDGLENGRLERVKDADAK